MFRLLLEQWNKLKFERFVDGAIGFGRRCDEKNHGEDGSLVLFAVVTFLIASSEATLYGADTTCDYTGLRVDNELSRMLARLPETHAFGPERVRAYWPGLEIGGFTVEGLNKLRLYGPLFPYCINGTRMLQVDFLNEGETSLSLPWKICSGHEGRFRLRTSLSRFTAQFRVVQSPPKMKSSWNPWVALFL
ncbi:hypothetical protein MTO96_026319 [Rhipicephalus appendiculatus]